MPPISTCSPPYQTTVPIAAALINCTTGRNNADNQAARKWRGMVGDFSKREDELGGKTLVIFGMGRIGARLAALAKAFEMRVIGVRQDPSKGAGVADKVVGEEGLLEVFADFARRTRRFGGLPKEGDRARALAG